MKRNLTLFLLLFLCLLSPIIRSEEIRFDLIRDKDGLSHNTVRAIMQGKEGFMWFGTLDGLNRYNGRSIVEFKTKSDAFPSQNDNRVRSLYQDSFQNIWLRSMGGEMNCYSPRLDRFVDYCPGRKNKNFISLNSATFFVKDCRTA